MSPSWTHLVRFVAEEDNEIHLGQVDASQYPDVGLATLEGRKVKAKVVIGDVFDGRVTEDVLHIKHTLKTLQLLSPVTADQVLIIRCMGLNYRDHAKEANMPIPEVPVLFIKPRTALTGPYPSTINIPKVSQDGSSDYEAELSLVLSKSGRDIPEEEAMDYVLGYTCSNDVSARKQQFKNSQWCFSKAIYNDQVVQDSNTKEMIFTIPQMISFLSQGTTLEKGTIIMTGTGPGIGVMRDPPITLNDGDDMRIEISEIGTLVNRVRYE
ncbi:hypothetical protein COL5a_001198 [Colletotrichum fioriniae]|uniref:uncharacterized protein n=1 Tax=Colletotrichum fioriniae TaxID=710243 RepID=UPI0032DAFFF8|nr:hypothetical protein COL5a_001198 [Colletotrichum fioriniae]KAJ3941658.1 hypothetical protein N0V96_008372 [Colletotrichum fioriniae]